MQTFYVQLESLRKDAALSQDPTLKHHQNIVEQQIQILRIHLENTVQRIAAAGLLNNVPPTPPLVDVVSLNAPSKDRSEGNDDLGRKRKRTTWPSVAHLPLCLQELGNPVIGAGTYIHIRIGAYMASNILVVNLQRLQPQVHIVPLIGHGTVILLHEALSMSPSLLSKSSSDKGGLATLVCACFWSLVKLGGVRGVTPDGQLVSKAGGIKMKDLLQMEINVMEALQWDILHALKKHPLLDIQSLIM